MLFVSFAAVIQKALKAKGLYEFKLEKIIEALTKLNKMLSFLMLFLANKVFSIKKIIYTRSSLFYKAYFLILTFKKRVLNNFQLPDFLQYFASCKISLTLF